VLDPAWVALSLSRHIGSKTLNALMRHFGSDTVSILAADADTLQAVPGVGPRIAHEIQSINLEAVKRAIERWQQAGVMILTPDDPLYPPRLRPLDDRPPTLFVRGHWRPMPEKVAAIVGTREPSPQAVTLAQNLGYELAQRGYTILSGLALGIDHAGHIGALASPESYLLAVLGSGVLNIYPPQHDELAQAVMERGALVCEVHPQATVNGVSLVARNRIISGMSDLVIVVESAVDGGAMHAARFARIQGRPVYTMDDDASGNRALIETGARVISPDVSELYLDDDEIR
jgi:DNA processing protein